MSEIVATPPVEIDILGICRKVKEMVDYNMVWTEDAVVFGVVEHWVSHAEWILTHDRKKGQIRDDCLHGDERVMIVREGKVVPVAIRDVVRGDTVVTYDFEKAKTTTSTVVDTLCKGIQNVFLFTFKNGTTLKATEDHPFWTKKTTGRKALVEYYKGKAYDKPDRGNDNIQTPFLREIPYTISNTMDPDLAFVIGHYLAEGGISKNQYVTVDGVSHISNSYSISGHEIPEEVLPVIDRLGIPHGKILRNNSDVPVLRFNKSWFTDLVKPFKRNGFDIELSEELINSTKTVLQSFLDGYFLGDGHYHKGYKVYSTSSETFAKQIYTIHKKLGQHCLIYKQERHGGVGTKPIWRVQNRLDYGFKSTGRHEELMNVAIKSIEPLGAAEVYDLSVFGTHAYIMENGLVAKNCDGFALTSAELCVHFGIPADLVRIIYCEMPSIGGHLICAVDDHKTKDTWILDNNERRVISWKHSGNKFISSLRLSERDTAGWRDIPA